MPPLIRTLRRATARPRFVVLLLMTALLALPASVSAAGWLADVPLAPAGAPAQRASVAFTGAGLTGAFSSGAGTFTGLERADLAPGAAAWGTPTAFSASDQPPLTVADGAGNAVTFASIQEGTSAVFDRLVGFYRPSGGSWDSGQKFLGGVNPYINGAPTAAMLPDGTAVAAIPTFSGMQFASRPPGASSIWAVETVPVTACDTGCSIDVATDASGNAIFLWTQSGTSPTASDGVYSVRRDKTGTYGAPQQVVSNVAGTSSARIGVAAAGDAVAVWLSGTSVRYSTRPATSGVWAASAAVTATVADGPDLVVDANGNATVSWIGYNGASASFKDVTAAYRPAGGAWSAAQPIGLGPAAVLSLDQASTPWIIWQVDSGAVDVRTQSGGGTGWGASTRLASAGSGAQRPVLAFDTVGNGAAVWNDGAQFHTRIYDGAAPVVAVTSASAQATAGAPVDLSASGSDPWSPVTISWDFGDGATGTGASVSHTYAASGTYSARATATDGAGNNSPSQVVTVTVAPTPAAAVPAAPPPPPTTLPPPVLGESINVFVLKDPVSIKRPGERRFRRLIKEAHLPNGTVIDTRKGRVLVVIADGKGGTDAAEFYAGVFEVNQPKRLKGLANIFLDGGGFRGCPKAPKNPHAQVAAGRKQSKHRSVRRLWGKGSGKFRTVGRFGSASVRGTWWLTDDRCDGTLFKVRQGKVAVRDFVKKITKIVTKGRRYFAAAKTR